MLRLKWGGGALGKILTNYSHGVRTARARRPMHPLWCPTATGLPQGACATKVWAWVQGEQGVVGAIGTSGVMGVDDEARATRGAAPHSDDGIDAPRAHRGHVG